MNIKVNENCPTHLQKANTSNKMVKFYKFNLSSVIPYAKPNHTRQSKSIEGSKLLKIDALPTNLLKNIKIEYSKDNKLLEKLFQMKNMVKIKKKSFI